MTRTFRSAVHEGRHGSFYNQHKPLRDENRSVAIPLAKDERIWIRCPVTLLRNFIYSPVAFLTAPLRRYNKAHHGQVPALFAVFSMALLLYICLTIIFVKLPGSKEDIDRSSFLLVILHLSSLPVVIGMSEKVLVD